MTLTVIRHGKFCLGLSLMHTRAADPQTRINSHTSAVILGHSHAGALSLLCLCYYEPNWGTCMWKDTIKKILQLNSAKSIFRFSVTSWYDEGAPWPRHGPKSAYFHCYQQGGPLYALHCGAHCKAVGARPETTRLQQGPHGHKQQRRCCRSSAAVRPVTQVWLLYLTLISLKTFKIMCPNHIHFSPWQHHANFHPIECVRREPWPSEGLLQRPPSPQQQQKAGGAHAAADWVSGRNTITDKERW